MNFTTLTVKKPLKLNELKELVSTMEIQETTDRETNKTCYLYGEHAYLHLQYDKEGNVTVLPMARQPWEEGGKK